MGRLYIVPTPIGNLEDVTLRALRVLHETSLILAEDTRHTRKLLTHYSISTRLVSYHQHNKRARLDDALRALESDDVALVSSAGMPAISDPGFELIEAAIEREIELEVLPGPSAVVTAVVAAALPSPGFIFVGFLPRKSGDRRARLQVVSKLPYSLVIYEAPHRLLPTLRDLTAVLGDRRAVAARELTKVHQQLLRGSLSSIIAHFETTEPRGELTLVVAGSDAKREDRTDEVIDELRLRHCAGEDARTAVGAVSRKYDLGRNETYRMWLEIAGK